MLPDLNNMQYAQSYARLLVDHINQLPNSRCCEHEWCCHTCNWIKTLHSIGVLDSIIDLLDKDFVRDQAWWDKTRMGVDIKWIEDRWSCPYLRALSVASEITA